jgi:hypothetical protein
MYRLLKDKNNEFQCEIRLEGATAKDAKARLFLEADGCEYVFSGRIQNERCIIPMGRLKKYTNLLESGKIRLEIIAEDTVFAPYENTYELDEEKKVTVEVIQPDYAVKKPIVEVKVEQPKPTKKENQKLDPVKEIRSYLKETANFDGSLTSLQRIIKDPTNRKFINRVCEAFKLEKKQVLKQILN